MKVNMKTVRQENQRSRLLQIKL